MAPLRRSWFGSICPVINNARVERSLRHQERELGLREVPGRHYVLEGQERFTGVSLSSGDRRYRERTGKRSFAEEVREVARPELRAAKSWEQLHERLADLGLRLEKRGRGLVLTDGERRVKASLVDRASSLKGLEKRLGRWRAPGRTFPAGKSRRWREVTELRKTVDELERVRSERQRRERAERGERLGEERRARELERLGARERATSAAYGGSLEDVYRDPVAARRRIEASIEKHGLRETAREVGERPERFGKLRGRGGPFASAGRWAAIEAAPEASRALRDHAGALREVEQAKAPAPTLGPTPSTGDLGKAGLGGAPGQVVQAGRKALSAGKKLAAQVASPARADGFRGAEEKLKLKAAALVQTLGWAVVARVVPAPQLQLLRVTIKLARKTLRAALDLTRGPKP